MLEHDTEPLPLAPLLASAPRDTFPAEPWPVRIAQGFARWLPILLMAALAVFTFWLARQSTGQVPEAADSKPSHEPDYEMRNFSIQQHGTAGTAPSLIEGDQVRHYPDNNTYEIDGVRLRWIDTAGRLTRVTARRALMTPARNEIVLQDQGHLLQPAQPGVDQGFELWGDHLIFDTQAQTLRSDQRVRVRYGEHQFLGNGMLYDQRGGHLDVRGGVRGTVQPTQR